MAISASLPAHGHVISGTGSIGKAGQSLTVKQSSTTGIINWSSFSIGGKNSVSFDNGAGATLNRVTGGNLSVIAGSLHATGSLYLMNNAGVIVSGNGRVVTGGSFVVSSGAIGPGFDADTRLKAGAGKIVNKGTIVSRGTATLTGSDVRDKGTIQASNVDLQATHRLSIDGAIIAGSRTDGGTVTARAHTIVIGTDGAIDASASGAGQKGGTISIVARSTTTVAGTLKAEGGRHGSGGFIDTSGKHVHVADNARISTRALSGKTGTWLIDPQDFTIAASGGDISGAALSSELASNDVLIQSVAGSHAGNGDIFVDDAVSWSSASGLTLDAYRNIVFNAPVTVTGSGGVALIDADQTQTSGTPGMYDGNAADGAIEFNGVNIAFADTVAGNVQGSLVINEKSYALESTISDLAGAISTNPSGYYALSDSYNASADGTYTSSPIATIFSGTFEGLGNTISDLTIAANSGEVGLFSDIFSGGDVRNLMLANASVTGGDSSDGRYGALAGENDGTIDNVIVSGAVSGNGSVGGLAGQNLGDITNSGSSVTVTASTNVGGLVGANAGTIYNSWAGGSVSATDTADVGGLAGFNDGDISQSFATGAVTGGDSYVGGLVGLNESAGTISQSYSTGVAKGATGSDVGGLIGVQLSGGTVTQSYATSAVSGGEDSNVGGLVGSNEGVVDESYELGTASGASGSHIGGLIGDNAGSAGGAIAVYFNNKRNAHGVGAGNKIASGGGLSRAQMEAASNFAGWTFGSLGSGADWVIVDLEGGLNNTEIDSSSIPAGGTTPMLLSEYSTTITNAHQLQLITLDLAATYTLANDIDAGATRNGADVWGSQGFISLGTANDSYFEGTFDGADRTISNLFIDDKSNMFVGFFGASNGTISNVSLVDASVHARQGQDNLVGLQVGGLVGANGGEIENASISGSVTASHIINGNQGVGGLAGTSVAGSIVSSRSSANVRLRGSATSDLAAGGLVGLNTNGLVSESFSTGSVVVKGMYSTAGGLVGFNDDGSVSQSWSSAFAKAVSNTSSAGSGGAAGGLVGYGQDGTISQSYALGSSTVSGGASSWAGGLAGYLYQTAISQSYSLGKVSGGGGAELGGLVGDDLTPGDIATSYFDIATSGIKAAQGAGNVANDIGITGLTTAQLQSGLPAGFSGSVWAVVAGRSFPYLQWQFNGTPEVVSGILRRSIGGARLSGRTISLMQNGVGLNSVLTGGQVTSYANGFYYFLLAPSTIGSSGVIAYNVAENAEAFDDQANGSVTGLDLTQDYLRETTAQDSLSAVNANLQSADGGNNIVVTTNLKIDETGTDLEIDCAIDSAIVDLVSAGTISESSAGNLQADHLTGSAQGSLALTGAKNAVTDLGAFSTAGHAFDLTDNHGLTVSGALKAGTAAINLTTVGKKHNLSIDSSVIGGTVSFLTTGEATESSAGAITASLLNVSANTGIDLASSGNKIKKLGTDTTEEGPNKVTL
ncbi:MAG: GLUG motif-containing protein [Rhizomicrobium sp.]